VDGRHQSQQVRGHGDHDRKASSEKGKRQPAEQNPPIDESDTRGSLGLEDEPGKDEKLFRQVFSADGVAAREPGDDGDIGIGVQEESVNGVERGNGQGRGQEAQSPPPVRRRGGDGGRPRVFVARIIPDDGLGPVVEACDAQVWQYELPPPRDELLRAVEGCDGILTLLTDRVDDELLERAGPQLKVVSNFAVGYDNIDVPACTRRGIPVGNTPGVLTETTADLAWALLMAAARRVAEGDRFVRAGRWRTWGPMLLMGPDVHGGTLGIVGFGRIGQAVARRAMGFGMTILYYDTHRADRAVERELGATFVPLDGLLSSSDFVSLHVNLTAETRHLMNAQRLRSMRRTAVLVNTSRGPVVDQRALFEALRDGAIGAAALDVTDPEPIAADDPLLTLDTCLVVPHIASASPATRGKMAAMAAANLLAGVRGERLPTPVNPEVYD